jgi:hypothetical protein
MFIGEIGNIYNNEKLKLHINLLLRNYIANRLMNTILISETATHSHTQPQTQ